MEYNLTYMEEKKRITYFHWDYIYLPYTIHTRVLECLWWDNSTWYFDPNWLFLASNLFQLLADLQSRNDWNQFDNEHTHNCKKRWRMWRLLMLLVRCRFFFYRWKKMCMKLEFSGFQNLWIPIRRNSGTVPLYTSSLLKTCSKIRKVDPTIFSNFCSF